MILSSRKETTYSLNAKIHKINEKSSIKQRNFRSDFSDNISRLATNPITIKLTDSILSIPFCTLHCKQSTNWNRFVWLVKAEVAKDK